MATYALIHGGGDVAASWDLVAGELRERGHDVVAVDLPSEDESAGLWDYAATVVDAIGDRAELVAGDREGLAAGSGLVVVGHSLGGFTAPLVCARVPADLLVLVVGMVPAPGESCEEWWVNAGYEDADRDDEPEHDGSDVAVFYHDVEPELAAAALARGRDQAATAMREPWPLDAWPDTPTRYLLCRDDRMFPAAGTRRMVHDRLGITPDEIDGGHCPFLSRPRELAERLETYRRTTADPATT